MRIGKTHVTQNGSADLWKHGQRFATMYADMGLRINSLGEFTKANEVTFVPLCQLFNEILEPQVRAAAEVRGDERDGRYVPALGIAVELMVRDFPQVFSMK